MSFNEKWNFDNVLFRATTIGLLDFLNKKIYLDMVPDKEIVQINVPFFYAMYGDERFLQDFFMKYGENCDGPVYAEGNTDVIPRGIVTMTSLAVNSASLTSKYVRGTYNKEVDGEIKAFSSFINIIPMSLVYDIELIAGTMLEAMKISQSIISTLYKSAKFNVDFHGFMVPCRIGFPQDYSIGKPLNFSYGDDGKIKMPFQIEMETYLFVTDEPSERWRGNVMENGIGNMITDVPGTGKFATFEGSVEDPRLPREQITDQYDANGNRK